MTDTPFDTIAAISTPPGESGIGIVRLSGDKALDIIEEIFYPHRKKDSVSRQQSFTMHLGYIKDGDEIVDEVLVSVMKLPHTYTREDIVEINCHGGAIAVNEVLRLVLSSGARLAQPGEFTKRAFINGRIDLSQAEAVLDIVKAKTNKSLETAVSQLKGRLSEKIEELIHKVKDILVILEANIDFPEEEDISPLKMTEIKEKILSVKEETGSLVKSYDTGRIYKDGLLTVISGKPNVGKSSIFNAFLRFDRAIVTPIPGTTRDTIEEQLNINGVPFILADTAGITEAYNLVEKEGVKRSRSYMDMAGLLLLVFDGSIPLDERDIDIAQKAKLMPHIIVINKVDLQLILDIKDLIKKTGINSQPVYISAKEGTGFKELEKRMLDMVLTGNTESDYSIMVTNTRHYTILKKALFELNHTLDALNENSEPELVAFDVRSVIDCLGEITGKVTNSDILEEIFSNFCIGK